MYNDRLVSLWIRIAWLIFLMVFFSSQFKSGFNSSLMSDKDLSYTKSGASAPENICILGVTGLCLLNDILTLMAYRCKN